MRKLLFILLLLPFISKGQVKTKLYVGGPLATNVYRGPVGTDSGLYVQSNCGDPNTVIPKANVGEFYKVYRGAMIYKDTCNNALWTSNPDSSWSQLAGGDTTNIYISGDTTIINNTIIRKALKIPLTDTTHAKKGCGNIIYDTILEHYFGDVCLNGVHDHWGCFDCGSGSGSVTSIATNDGTGIKGGTITTSGTLFIDTAIISTKANVDSKTVTLIAGTNVTIPETATQNLGQNPSWTINATASGGISHALGVNGLHNRNDSTIALGLTPLDSITAITSNTNDQFILNGTWTASANNQSHYLINPSLTARATTSDQINAINISPTLNSGANAQNIVALYINPTYGGGFTVDKLAILHNGNIEPTSDNLWNLGKIGVNYAGGYITDWHGTTATVGLGATSLLFNDENGKKMGRMFSGASTVNLGFVGFQVGSDTYITTSNNGPMIEAFGSIKNWGDLLVSTLTTPVISSVTNTGATGATTYTYKVVAVTGDDIETDASAAVSTTTGNATLSSSNYNTISWAEVKGARKYKLYRTAGGATQGLINTVFGLSITDQGSAGDGSTASAVNHTGKVGIGTTTPDISAALDVTSTVQGFLPPRMTTTQRDAIASTAEGLVIHNTTAHALQYYNGSAWQSISSSTGTVTSIATSSPITGGTITTTGTIGIDNAAADGTTKGAASFTANDFDASSGNVSIDYTNGQKASSTVPGFATSNQVTGVIGDCENGQGTVIVSGSKGFITIPFNCTITNWYIVADVSGTIQFDVKRSGTSIIGAGNKPALSSQVSANAAVSSWTSTTVTAGDILEWVVDASPAPTTVTKVTVTLKVYK